MIDECVYRGCRERTLYLAKGWIHRDGNFIRCTARYDYASWLMFHIFEGVMEGNALR